MKTDHIPPGILSAPAALQDKITYLLFGLMVITLCGVFSYQADFSTRLVFVRYWHFITAGIYAFVLPHILYPLPRVEWLQQINPAPRLLWRLQLSALQPLLILFLISYIILIFFQPEASFNHISEKFLLLGESLLYLLGISFYAMYRYSIIGGSSQAWSEGRKGAGFLQGMAQVGQTSATPAGMYPTFGATIGIAVLGMMLVVAHAYISALFGTFEAVTVYALLFIFGISRFAGLRQTYDRQLFHTSAFYNELFRNPGGYRKEGREPIAVDAIYWSPKFLKPAVWSIMTQTDRRLPFGRIMILLVLFLWTLLYSGFTGTVFQAALLMIIFIKNVTIFLSISNRLAPLPFNITIQSTAAWAFTRFCVNVRWVVPFYFALLIAALFSSQLSYSEVHFWILVDVLVALFTAVFASLIHEGNFKKKYA